MTPDPSKRQVRINYPHQAEPALVLDDPDVQVWFGRYDVEVELQTADYLEPVAQACLILEPPIVHHHAYQEDYRREFRRVFAWGGPDTGNVTWYRHRLPPLWPELPEQVHTRPWNQRYDGIVAITSNKYSQRRADLAELAAIACEKRMLFDVFGRVPFDEPWYGGAIDGPLQGKIERMSHYRYAYCAENFEDRFYRTEKLPEALAAGCIPIYNNTHDSMTRPAYPDMPHVSVNNLVFVIEDGESLWEETMKELETKWPVIREDMDFRHVARLIAAVV